MWMWAIFALLLGSGGAILLKWRKKRTLEKIGAAVENVLYCQTQMLETSVLHAAVSGHLGTGVDSITFLDCLDKLKKRGRVKHTDHAGSSLWWVCNAGAM